MFIWARSIRNAKSAGSELDSFVLQLKAELTGSIENYSFYTDGHPYTWTEVDFEELLSDMRKQLPKRWVAGGIGHYRKFCCWCRVDNPNLRVYLVPDVLDFDASGLMHYEDWVNSSGEVAENIARHHEQHS